jgi:hypothetical protein
MPAPYWVGDEVPLSFEAKDSSGSGPASCTVDVYDETNTKVVDGASPTVSGPTVDYNIAESVTDVAGSYRAVFIVVFAGTVTRRHVIHFLIRDPALSYIAYGSVAGIEGLVGDVVEDRTFTLGTVPSYDTVTELLEGVASALNVELSQQGYQTPVRAVDDPVTYQYLSYVNNAGAAARVLSTMPMESYVMPDEDQSGGDRRQMLDRELSHAIRRIQSQELPATRSTGMLSRVFAGSQENSDGNTKNPLFTRGMTDYPSSRSLTS